MIVILNGESDGAGWFWMDLCDQHQRAVVRCCVWKAREDEETGDAGGKKVLVRDWRWLRFGREHQIGFLGGIKRAGENRGPGHHQTESG
jgi:hypothetical protein